MKSSSAQAVAENGAHRGMTRLPNLTARMPPTFHHMKVHLQTKTVFDPSFSTCTQNPTPNIPTTCQCYS